MLQLLYCKCLVTYSMVFSVHDVRRLSGHLHRKRALASTVSAGLCMFDKARNTPAYTESAVIKRCY